MPNVSLPDDLIKDLENSQSEMIDGTQRPGVATYLASNGVVRVDIYVGFKLDGLILYQNISSLEHNMKMQFALQPVVMCHADVLTFNPDEYYAIAIQVFEVVRCVEQQQP